LLTTRSRTASGSDSSSERSSKCTLALGCAAATCMRRLSADEVIDAARELLAETAASAAATGTGARQQAEIARKKINLAGSKRISISEGRPQVDGNGLVVAVGTRFQ